MVPIPETRPTIDLPGQAPAGAPIPPVDQRLPCCLHQGAVLPRYIGAGIDAPEMRDMPVRIRRVVFIFQPFLQLSISAYPVRRYPVGIPRPYSRGFGIYPQDTRGSDTVMK